MASQPKAPRLDIVATIYAGFVVYGSLVPLRFVYRPFTDALATFAHIPYLELAVASRADWVANILLYIPLAFFATGALARRVAIIASTILVIGLTALLAIGVEFAQIFFPPRTVSLNDLVAEAIGSVFGIILWHTTGGHLIALWQQAVSGGRQAARAITMLYSLAYVAYSLFPYDFLLSPAEVADKFRLAGEGFLLNPACGPVFNCAAALLSEMLIVMPLGVFLGIVLAPTKVRIAAAFVWGLLFGLTIESLQIFLASGVSQAASMLTRACGAALGLTFYRYIRADWLIEYRPQLKAIALAAVPLYIVLLLGMIGFFTSSLEPSSVAAAKLHEVHFMPLYYYYFTSETQAMQSLLHHAGAYGPVALIIWIVADRRSAWFSVLFAFALAGSMETLKLFLESRRADPTNVLIAAVAAGLAHAVLRRLTAAPHTPHSLQMVFNERHSLAG